MRLILEKPDMTLKTTRLAAVKSRCAWAISLFLVPALLTGGNTFAQQSVQLLDSVCTPGVNSPVTDPGTNRT